MFHITAPAGPPGPWLRLVSRSRAGGGASHSHLTSPPPVTPVGSGDGARVGLEAMPTDQSNNAGATPWPPPGAPVPGAPEPGVPVPPAPTPAWPSPTAPAYPVPAPAPPVPPQPAPPPVPVADVPLAPPEAPLGAVNPDYPDLPNPAGTGEVFPPPPYGAALLPDDPPLIGGFWLDGRLAARASGVAFLAHEAGPSAGGDEPVMLIILSQGAAEDAAARDRLAGEVNKMHADTVIARGGAGQNEGRLAGKYRADKDEPIPAEDTAVAPWVALAYDGTVDAIAEADRVLRSVDLSSTPPLGAVRGPGFQLPWVNRTKPGNWRRWPLPWPGRSDRASWVPMLVSWLLMLVLAALALLIIVLLFQNPPPPSGGGGGGGGGDASSSQSASASGGGSQSDTASESNSASGGGSDSGSESASPSSASGSQGESPSPGGFGSPSQTASMNSPTTGSASQGQPSRNENL